MGSIKQQNDFSGFWEIIKNLVFVLGIMFFFSGYNYLNFYFKEFGLSLQNISIEITSFYMIAFSVLNHSIPNILLTAFIVMLIPIVYVFREKLKDGTYIVFFIAVIIYFPVEYGITKRFAKTTAENRLCGKAKANLVYFSFKEDFVKRNIDSTRTDSLNGLAELTSYDRRKLKILRTLNRDGNLFLFYKTESNYFVFYNPNNPPCNFVKNIQTFVIPCTAVNYAVLDIDKQKIQEEDK